MSVDVRFLVTQTILLAGNTSLSAATSFFTMAYSPVPSQEMMGWKSVKGSSSLLDLMRDRLPDEVTQLLDIRVFGSSASNVVGQKDLTFLVFDSFDFG